MWNRERVADLQDELAQLVHRSNLLGADRSVANWGGGNTSVKTTVLDFRGREVEMMWVKGSGSDLATMQARHFTALRLDDILPLMARDELSDEEMVAYLSHCMLDASHPRASIETLLHAFLPFKHIDHTHPDAIVSICCSDNGRSIAEEIYGKRFVWVPYVRPGFLLSKMIAEAVQANPEAELVLMEKHGLVTWGETSEACYRQTIAVINEAQEYIEARAQGKPLFGGQRYTALPEHERRDILAQVLPVIRGSVSRGQRAIVTYDDADDVLSFVNSVAAPQLVQVGSPCPDHLVHTKRVPLYIDWDPATRDSSDLQERIKAGIVAYQQAYQDYFERNKSEGDVLVFSAPRVILIPGIGMVNTGKSWAMAQVSAALYHRAIAVMHGSTTLGKFTSLNEQESYAIEYWPLELYKLSLQPPEAEFSRQVGMVTGGAGGIGGATCRRFAAAGMHVVVADINLDRARQVADEINQAHGEGRASAVGIDVTNEQSVAQGIRDIVLTYGGLDVVVNNAGIASSQSLTETTLQEWNRNMDVLSTGYFLIARESLKLLQMQGMGGSMVFVASKNSVYAGKNAAAYSTAKAAEVHLARCIAVEGGDYGVRVNVVLPDAVLQGSTIWSSSWREERAAAYGIQADELEEHYRKRTILGVNVLPEDIANAIVFLASSQSAKTTGCMITVDGGVPAAFVR
ncbi:MAG: bifunctional aldolase/short-chain dehydrogenase [Ktedonobacteraceae bacterium]|nr:bifunctional aldolase/short-chain dehydrogenase [Ktedonobacteraceae bacterium]